MSTRHKSLRWLTTGALGASLALVPAPIALANHATGADPAHTIISNGTIGLGVWEHGHLNVPGPTSASGTSSYGVRFLPLNNDGTAAGCTCEGWGAGDALSGVSGWANDDEGVYNVHPVAFEHDADSAVTQTEIHDAAGAPSLLVTHDYHPSATPNLYEVTVTIANVSDAVVDMRYRRVMDWDIEPTEFWEYSTIVGSAAENVLNSTSNGFDTANPLSDPTGTPGDFEDLGPTDHGALFTFGFGMVPAGESRTFTTYYGAAATEDEALDALAVVGAETYSLGQPSLNPKPNEGTPNTFVFGFTGVGGSGLVGSDRRPPVTLRVTQDPAFLPAGGGAFDVNAILRNIGTATATGATATITLGTGLTLAGPGGTLTFGDIAAGATEEQTWHLRAASTCEGYDTSYTVTSDYAERPAEEPVRTVTREFSVPGTCGLIAGNVTSFPGGGPVEGAEVEACLVPGASSPSPSPFPTASPSPAPDPAAPCEVGVTDELGNYVLPGLPGGTFNVTARPPLVASAADWTPVQALGVEVATGESATQDFEFSSLTPPPSGTVIESRDTGVGGLPVVYYRDDLDLRTTGCVGGIATWRVTVGGEVVRNGTLTETSTPGTYAGVIPALSTFSGFAEVSILVDCPGDVADSVVAFDIYIDPSGWVRNTLGEPIVGATVQLFDGPTIEGPWTLVPNGSLIMSPKNRTNPDLTDAEGHFGWDVVAGFYLVRASKEGCTSTTGGAFAESRAMIIPPPVFDLDLRLNCGETAPGGGAPITHAPAPGGGGGGGPHPTPSPSASSPAPSTSPTARPSASPSVVPSSSSHPATPSAPPAAASSITLSANRTAITWGNAPTLSGVLRDARGNPVANTAVTVSKKEYGETAYETVATVTTDATGAYRLVTRPSTQTTYVARSGSAAASLLITVAQRIDLTSILAPTATRSAVGITGDLTPGRDGTSIGLATLTPRWSVLDSTRTEGRTFTVGSVLPRGRHTVVVFTSARNGLRAGSRSITVVVP